MSCSCKELNSKVDRDLDTLSASIEILDKKIETLEGRFDRVIQSLETCLYDMNSNTNNLRHPLNEIIKYITAIEESKAELNKVQSVKESYNKYLWTMGMASIEMPLNYEWNDVQPVYNLCQINAIHHIKYS